MDNPEEVLQCLDQFAKLKPKNIPRELEDYLMYVARTGDPVYQWPTVKILFREKLLNVITEFYESTPTLELNPSPNVDPFNYETMKTVLLERLEAFSNAPFTVQRLCELLTTPRKEYNRPDKFMRAIEKNILVVSTREPGSACWPEGALSDPIPNGVSDTSEANKNESISDSINNIADSKEEISSQIPSLAPAMESEEKSENQLVSETVPVEESNHVDTEKPELGATVSSEAEATPLEEEPNKITVNESEESMVATESSDSVTIPDVPSVPEVIEPVIVTSSECVSKSDVIDESDPAVCLSETNEVESAPTMSSSLEITSVGDALSETEQNEVPTETSHNLNVVESDSSSKTCEETPSIPLSDADQAGSEAIPESSTSKEEPSKVIEDSEPTPLPEESSSSELAISSTDSVSSVTSNDQEPTADSTASAVVEDKEIPPSDAVSTGPPDEISTDIVDSSKIEEKDSSPVSKEALEGSEAAPAVEKVESKAKENVEAVKGDAEAKQSITSSEGEVTRGVKGADEELMDVDEGSNQAEAMDVGDEDEPMEVCDDSAVEEMTTSPQETAQ